MLGELKPIRASEMRTTPPDPPCRQYDPKVVRTCYLFGHNSLAKYLSEYEERTLNLISKALCA